MIEANRCMPTANTFFLDPDKRRGMRRGFQILPRTRFKSEKQEKEEEKEVEKKIKNQSAS